jgi:hypothetical protein
MSEVALSPSEVPAGLHNATCWTKCGGGMSVRKRKWVTSSGEDREAWVVDHVDQRGE